MSMNSIPDSPRSIPWEQLSDAEIGAMVRATAARLAAMPECLVSRDPLLVAAAVLIAENLPGKDAGHCAERVDAGATGESGGERVKVALLAPELVDRVLPQAITFIVRRMRLSGIVPAFFAGAAYAEVTGAPTATHTPEAAFDTINQELRSRLGMSDIAATAVVRGLAPHVVNIDLLPESAASEVVRHIALGDLVPLPGDADQESA